MNTATIWRTTLERLDQTSVDTVIKAWLQDAHLSSLPHASTDDIDAPLNAQDQGLYFMLQVPNDLARDVISTRWRHIIEEALADVTGQPVMISVANASDEPPAEQELPSDKEAFNHSPSSANTYQQNYTFYDIAPRSAQADSRYMSNRSADTLEDWDNEQRANILMHNRLNPRYTFDAFIVGGSNRLAHAASLAVAEAPGESYNPLFLYGGVGLGKTHLLHAIGHQGVQTGLAVLYVSSEQFTNEIINAIRYRTTEEFRAKYRSVDILLVDDIQFIAGKESTEEEFFHTFNSLYEMSKQIVICSDRPPKAIVSLEERLRSRFEWGLIADIQPPDLETRMAILRVKADVLRYRVPDDIIAYIAGRVQTNIRELEGCLNRLMAYQQLHRTDLTLDVARAAMSSLGNDTRESHLNSRQIAEAVAEYYHISFEAMCSKQRDKYIVMPRQIAMYLIRQETQASLLEIGQLFGGRDHSTVLHACEKIDRAINLNPTLRREIIAIREQLQRE
ncbi:MAG TPA: chromosomal replication initiator protein DnaA [Ktedonobacteraceae bacterium]|nr:chromosomal replication initiator protein DnaA [Ktedonobacteraceae bacterium]